MTLKEYVYQYRRKHKISMDKLAKHANIARGTLYNMIDDDSSPSLINLTKLAIAMSVHPQYLIQLEWEKHRLMDDLATPIFPLEKPNLCSFREDDSRFVEENIAIGQVVCTDQVFVNRMRLQNTGRTVWEDRWFVCQDDDECHHSELTKFSDKYRLSLTPKQRKIPIPTTRSGEVVELAIEMQAPSIAMTAISYWKMTDVEGNILSPDRMGLFMKVRVVSANLVSITS